MSERDEHLEFLLSRRLDGDLTVEELAELRNALADNADLAAEAEQYERLNRLLAGFRPLPAAVDFDSFARSVSEGVNAHVAERASATVDREIDPDAVHEANAPTGPRLDAVAEDYRAVDDLVRDAAGPVPEVDWDAFKARVSNEVKREAASKQQWPRVAAWFAPLAAAAAVAIVLWGPWAADPSRSALDASTVVLVSLDVPERDGVVKFAFDESDAPSESEDFPAPHGSAIAISGMSTGTPEGVEDAYFY